MVSLQPRSAAARQIMPELKVSLAVNDFSLKGTELIFVDGSRMRNEFAHFVTNAVADESLFQWKAPSDFKVTEPFAK